MDLRQMHAGQPGDLPLVRRLRDRPADTDVSRVVDSAVKAQPSDNRPHAIAARAKEAGTAAGRSRKTRHVAGLGGEHGTDVAMLLLRSVYGSAVVDVLDVRQDEG